MKEWYLAGDGALPFTDVTLNFKGPSLTLGYNDSTVRLQGNFCLFLPKPHHPGTPTPQYLPDFERPVECTCR